MVWWIRVCTALAEGLSSIPIISEGWLTTTCSSSSRSMTSDHHQPLLTHIT
ncbi:hypothetical protein I79_019810 [Cricetulus griseus]|uniref:Uncharacterized protein n=1 Tax=Cricetulus griseus TaxID=10029 RepID=G3I8E6_CRIGR|nr:hypothetical protein I79_019810 [Cricetulus griseus]